MLAIDTNLLVRYLTGDDPKQSSRARALIDGNDIFVSATVLLESEWILRSVYGFTAHDVAAALTAFAGLPRVTTEDPDLIAKALDWALQGMDFADALHLARAKGCDAFVSFDRRFAELANAIGDLKVQAP